MNLWDYQKEGVDFIGSRKKAYIAFDPGMGKTLTALAAMNDNGKKNIMLVAEKNEIVNSENFRKEVETHFSEDLQYVNLREDEPESFEKRAVCGINPDGLVKIDPDFIKQAFDSIIVDEATLAKSTTTLRFKRLRKVCKEMNHIALLSGTPMMNGASEIFAPLVLLGHWLGGDGTVKARMAFERIFAGGFYKQIRNTGNWFQDYKWWAKGANHVRELRWMTRDAFIFKSKGETSVFKKKDRQVVRVPMSEEWIREYERAWDKYLSSVHDHNRKASRGDRKSIKNIKELQHVIENGQMYQVNSKWKAKKVVEDIASGKYGSERIIVFSIFIETDRIIQEELEKAGVSFRTFEDMKEWKAGTEQVLVGRIKSHAKGGNLPEASVALFVDMDFVPTNNIQAENRIDRPEQTRDMTVRYYISEGPETIDKHVQEIVADKMRKIEKFMTPFATEEAKEMPRKVLDLIEKNKKEFSILADGGGMTTMTDVDNSLGKE